MTTFHVLGASLSLAVTSNVAATSFAGHIVSGFTNAFVLAAAAACVAAAARAFGLYLAALRQLDVSTAAGYRAAATTGGKS